VSVKMRSVAPAVEGSDAEKEGAGRPRRARGTLTGRDPAAEILLRRAGSSVFPGFRLRRLARTGSTQDLVMAAAAAGAAEGFCCMASEQTAGRGRSGRDWVAPPGGALLASLLLRRRAAVAAGLPIAAGLAVADGVERVAGVRCQLKWPNDVIAGGGKLAGILVEVGRDGATSVGIGVNLEIAEFPPGIAGASLHRLAGRPVSPDELLAAILAGLGDRLRQLEAGGVLRLRDDWTQRALGLGGQVRAVLGPEIVTGTALGLDDDGALLIDSPQGRVRLVAGDVHLLA